MTNKKLTHEEKNKLRNNFNLSHRRTEIYSLDYDESKYGINWSAIGTVSVKEAKEFITSLRAAIKLVTKLNK